MIELKIMNRLKMKIIKIFPDSKPLAVHRWQPPVDHWRFFRWFSGGPLVATAQGFLIL